MVAIRANVVTRFAVAMRWRRWASVNRTRSALIATTGGWLELSVVNASSTVAVSGERQAVAAIVDTVQRSLRPPRITVGFRCIPACSNRSRDELCEQLPDSKFMEAGAIHRRNHRRRGGARHHFRHCGTQTCIQFRRIESIPLAGLRFIESAHPAVVCDPVRTGEGAADLPDPVPLCVDQLGTSWRCVVGEYC